MDPDELDDLTPTEDAIAADREHGGPGRLAGDDRQADVAADHYERWLDTWP